MAYRVVQVKFIKFVQSRVSEFVPQGGQAQGQDLVAAATVSAYNSLVNGQSRYVLGTLHNCKVSLPCSLRRNAVKMESRTHDEQ